jgi:hypothetical protein
MIISITEENTAELKALLTNMVAQAEALSKYNDNDLRSYFNSVMDRKQVNKLSNEQLREFMKNDPAIRNYKEILKALN